MKISKEQRPAIISINSPLDYFINRSYLPNEIQLAIVNSFSTKERKNLKDKLMRIYATI